MKLDIEKFDKLVDEAMKERQGPPMDEAALTGAMRQLMKRMVGRMLHGELTHHLGYEKHDAAGRGSGNSRNASSQKTLKGELGEVEIDIPRGRNGELAPRLIGKYQTRLTGLDEKIISMYARRLHAVP